MSFFYSILSMTLESRHTVSLGNTGIGKSCAQPDVCLEDKSHFHEQFRLGGEKRRQRDVRRLGVGLVYLMCDLVSIVYDVSRLT